MISVIVCTYNRGAYIYNTLEHIALNDFPTEDYEIILIDNNCTDDTVSQCELFQKNFPNVRYRYFKETSQGLSYARNRGIAESTGDCLVFLDDDALAEEDYLRNLHRHLMNFPEMMAFGGKIIPKYETGFEPTWMSPRLVPAVSAIDKSPSVAEFTGNSYPIGANMGFRKSCIEKTGGFNTALGRSRKNLIGGEEKDIFARVKAADSKIFYFPDLVVHHIIPESRTTLDYLKRFGVGVGNSERIRCSTSFAFCRAILVECWKWIGSLALYVYYLLLFKKQKANAIILFRWNVTKGLLNYDKSNN